MALNHSTEGKVAFVVVASWVISGSPSARSMGYAGWLATGCSTYLRRGGGGFEAGEVVADPPAAEVFQLAGAVQELLIAQAAAEEDDEGFLDGDILLAFEDHDGLRLVEIGVDFLAPVQVAAE